METRETVFCRPAAELSCIIGNLFTTLEPPCKEAQPGGLTLCGYTHAGHYGRLTIYADRCVFCGAPADVAAVLDGVCPEGGGCGCG